MASLMGAAILLSYFDRQALPVAVAQISKDIPISNIAFSHLQGAFLLAYALMYAGGGKLLDYLGTRVGFLAIMLWWSVACFMHGFASTVAFLGATQFMLGIGEGGGFPGVTKAIFEWFPETERSTAMGIVNSCGNWGAVIAPPAIFLIFYVAGALGLVWTFLWAKKYRPAVSHPGLSSEERGELSPLFEIRDQGEKSARGWIELFRFPQVWGLFCGKCLSDSAWYFYLFWLPKYLHDQRGFDLAKLGAIAWIPYAAGGFGAIAGGWFSSWLIKRGFTLNHSRKAALAVAASLMLVALAITRAPAGIAVGLFGVAFFGQQFWSTIMMTLPADVFPEDEIGSVAGLEGCGGALGGVVFGLLVGYLLDHGFSYAPVFVMVSIFYPVAFLLILLTFRNIEPVAAAEKTASAAV
jgi:ACS family hexuronate transporter-like MFS transporter